MEQSKEYYKQLAEAREFDLDTLLKPAAELLAARGIVFSMLSDVMLYGTKVGKNEKYKESISRLMELDNFLDTCNTYSNRNIELRRMLKSSMIERDRLENIILEKDKDLEKIEKAFNSV